MFDRFPCDEVYGMHNWYVICTQTFPEEKIRRITAMSANIPEWVRVRVRVRVWVWVWVWAGRRRRRVRASGALGGQERVVPPERPRA